MVKSRKRKGGKGNVWEVTLPGLKKPAEVRTLGTTWLVCPESLTEVQRQSAVELVKKRLLG